MDDSRSGVLIIRPNIREAPSITVDGHQNSTLPIARLGRASEHKRLLKFVVSLASAGLAGNRKPGRSPTRRGIGGLNRAHARHGYISSIRRREAVASTRTGAQDETPVALLYRTRVHRVQLGETRDIVLIHLDGVGKHDP